MSAYLGNRPHTKVCNWVQEPTGAATMAEMEALVVSQETTGGAQQINEWRIQHGSRPLSIVVVDLVGSQGSDRSNKLSSTRLRNEEAHNSAA